MAEINYLSEEKGMGKFNILDEKGMVVSEMIYGFSAFKPILYPLDHLTKPIWYEGKEIVPINMLYTFNKGYEGVRWDWICETIEENNQAMMVLPFFAIMLLVKYRLDLFGS